MARPARPKLTNRRHPFQAKHPTALTALNNLAGLMRDDNRLTEALPLYKECHEGCHEART